MLEERSFFHNVFLLCDSFFRRGGNYVGVPDAALDLVGGAWIVSSQALFWAAVHPSRFLAADPPCTSRFQTMVCSSKFGTNAKL